jgi:hypothetical protein
VKQILEGDVADQPVLPPNKGRFKEGLIKSYNIKVYDDDEEK